MVILICWGSSGANRKLKILIVLWLMFLNAYKVIKLVKIYLKNAESASKRSEISHEWPVMPGGQR